MKDAILTAILCVAIVIALLIEQALPPLGFVHGARIYLVPVLFCLGACMLSFPGMLVLALLSGFLYDFANLQVVGGSVEIRPGWTILLFVAFGAICQGVSPLVRRGQWWLPPLLSALSTVVLLGFQFLVLTMKRFDTGGLYWSEIVAWRILAPGVLASLLCMVLSLAVLLVSDFGPGRRHVREF